MRWLSVGNVCTSKKVIPGSAWLRKAGIHEWVWMWRENVKILPIQRSMIFFGRGEVSDKTDILIDSKIEKVIKSLDHLYGALQSIPKESRSSYLKKARISLSAFSGHQVFELVGRE